MHSFLVTLFVAIATTTVVLQLATATPLDDYVWAKDDNFGWVDMGLDYTFRGKVMDRGFTAYTLNMTSQKWLTDDVFTADSQSKSIWWHYLMVIVPDEIKFSANASLWITGGSMGSSPPKPDEEDMLVSAALAMSTGTVTGVLYQIPNEHMTFADDPILKSRSEDAIIAYTWDHFLKDPSKPEWLVRFPMVKASVRAMDAVQQFVRAKGIATADYFSVSGASKRGWTTWLVGAVDPTRVKLIVPVVLDAINFVDVMHHAFRSYGAWTYALQDYIDMNITTRFDDPNMNILQQMEDPYFYKDRLTMPKLVVNAAMDEFQQPDDTHYWWNDMPEPKHFLIAPNAEHSLATGILEVVPAICAFIQSHLYNDKTPKFDWTINKQTGEIVATLEDHGVVHEANVWYAYSCGVNNWDGNTLRRDYRVAHMDNPCSCGIFAEGMCANLKTIWGKKPLEEKTVRGRRTYSTVLDAPGDGRWVAYFIDIKFVNTRASPFDIMAMYRKMKPNTEKTGIRITDKLSLDADFGGFPHDFGHFFEFTTEVSVFPDVFPYPDCSGVSCGSRVV